MKHRSRLFLALAALVALAALPAGADAKTTGKLNVTLPKSVAQNQAFKGKLTGRSTKEDDVAELFLDPKPCAKKSQKEFFHDNAPRLIYKDLGNPGDFKATSKKQAWAAQYAYKPGTYHTCAYLSHSDFFDLIPYKTKFGTIKVTASPAR